MRLSKGRSLLAGWIAVFLLVLGTSGLTAQTATGLIRGRVLSEEGAGLPGATVTARNIGTGAERSALAGAEGGYTLPGLQPALYEIRVQMIGYAPYSQQVRVLVGQSLDLNLQLTPQAVQIAGLVVTSTRALEVKTPEIATNITSEQIESLPQIDRNFLNLAGLAPGITVSRDERNKQITAAGLPATKINVFVDGASLKNDMLEGGIHGQDASRGNPFPQIALQEFRVITQNYKAEYQQAASAVVTATTKSGTNEFKVDGFVLGQNKGLVGFDAGAKLICSQRKENNEKCDPKPEYERLQVGLSAGGPIIQDRLHYFLAYEGNYQNRQEIVNVGQNWQQFRQQFAQYEGTFDQPFRSTLGVAKLSWVPATNQTLDLSWNSRFEEDKTGFGGTTSFESAENIAIRTNIVTLRHSLVKGGWLNEANLSAQRATWNPTALSDAGGVGLNYDGVMRIGARSTEQNFVQDRIALRNDLTRSGINWNGQHVFKMGATVSFLNYNLEKRFNGNPEYIFNPNVSMTVPVRAVYGEGDPGMDESNVQFGFYIQDDWDVTDRLQLNLGIRWDAETNQFNNNWVTPDSIRTKLANFVEGRFSDGNNRKMYLGAFQPRVGFSYDLTGNQRTVLHGGAGLYYDREVWNHMIDERFRLQWRVRNFNFTNTGEAGKIAWKDEYLTREGLESIINQGTYGVTSEVFLLANDTEPPRSVQWSAGIRQTVADNMIASATYRGVRGYNLLNWYCGAPHPEHGYCEGGRSQGLPYDPVLSTDEGRSYYDALDLTFEKPYTSESRWGVTVAYTFADAERKGSDFFTLDFPGVDPAAWPVIPARIEKHRVTASGIVDLPYGFQLGSIVQWGSGLPYNRKDETDGWGPARVKVDWYSEDAPNFKQVDFRLHKSVDLPRGGRVGVVAELINAFDWDNFRGYEEMWKWGDGSVNQNFGKPQPGTADTGRRLQLGMTFGF